MKKWAHTEDKLKVIGFDSEGERREATFANEEEAYEWAANYGVSIEFIKDIKG